MNVTSAELCNIVIWGVRVGLVSTAVLVVVAEVRHKRQLRRAATPPALPPRDPGPFRTPGVLLPQPSLTGVHEDFCAEVINGWLLVRIKIPSVVCATCGSVYTPVVLPETVAMYYAEHHPLNVSASPWVDAGWEFIDNGKPYPENRRALVCVRCAAPIKAAKTAGESLLTKQTAAVAARVTAWNER